MKIIYLISISLFSAFAGNAQNNNVLDDPRVKQAYKGTEKEMTVEQQAWIKNILERCEIKELAAGSVQHYPLLSSKKKIDKYGAAVDNTSEDVNPLQYAIDFYQPQDQFFLVDGTNKILIVRGKK